MMLHPSCTLTIICPFPFAINLAAIRYCQSADHTTYIPEFPKPYTCPW